MTTNMTIDTGYKLLRRIKEANQGVVVLVKESTGWRDYMVEVWADGEHRAYLDYFTTDKAEAIKHAEEVALQVRAFRLNAYNF